jgi:serine/threonine-protein kinase HipA
MAAKGKVDVANVELWGQLVGAVRWDARAGLGVFEYDPKFTASGLEVSPIRMRLRRAEYNFPTLRKSEDFQGLPGLLADVLPDNWGTELYKLWLAARGRSLDSVTPVERLCYIGSRAMGALEFKPAVDHPVATATPVDIAELSDFARKILNRKQGLRGTLNAKDKHALASILRVGTSAGGNRAKAIIAVHPKTQQVVSGETQAPSPLEHWILKFDGTGAGSGAQPQGYGRIELAYHSMARTAGIEMMDCKLWEENGRAHFMTRRFDRVKGGGRLHYQSLAALMHLDHNQGHSYEQAFEAALALKLPYPDMEQLFRRMVFNVAGRNQDDHTKNFGFLMDPTGRWAMSPAFDLTFNYNPDGQWTHSHQLSVAGKHREISRDDLLKVGDIFGIKRANGILEQVVDAVATWPKAAKRAGVEKGRVTAVEKLLRVQALKAPKSLKKPVKGGSPPQPV